MASIYVGQEFLSRLALDNIDHFYIFWDVKYLIFFMAIGATYALLIFFVEKGRPPSVPKFNSTFAILLIFSIFLAGSSTYWLPSYAPQTGNNKFSRVKRNLTSPIASLYGTLFLQDLRYSEPLLHRQLKAYELE